LRIIFCEEHSFNSFTAEQILLKQRHMLQVRSYFICEKFEDTKGVIRSCKSKKDRQYNRQQKKDKQWSTKYYTQDKR